MTVVIYASKAQGNEYEARSKVWTNYRINLQDQQGSLGLEYADSSRRVRPIKKIGGSWIGC